jgi:2-methylfumaryl-CoA isomerase
MCRQLIEEDPRASSENPMFEAVEQPGIGAYLMPRSPLDFASAPWMPAQPTPVLGADTEEVLADLLGLIAAEIGRLCDDGIAAGAGAGRVRKAA